MDFVLNFFTAYFDKDEGKWVTDLHRISFAYLRTWAIVDLISLIPWFLMEPTPDAFVTDGFSDIVKFGKLCAKLELKIVLRPGPFICDGPDFGGLPWWLMYACHFLCTAWPFGGA